MLMTPQVPSPYGGSVARENAGDMLNRGWEVTLGYRAKTGDFRHNFSLNLADSKNKVTKFTGREQISSSGKIIREGEPLSSYYGLKVERLFQADDFVNGVLREDIPIPDGITRSQLGPGDIKYVNQNDDKIIDNNDRVIYGNAFPRFTFGINYSVSWKGFDLNMLFQGVLKRDYILRGELKEPYQGNWGSTMYTHMMDYWRPDNTGAKYPRLSNAGSPSNNNNWQRLCDINVNDGKYIRLKNIQIGYTLPKRYSSIVGIEKFRISLNAQNLFTIATESYFDPEATEFGNDMAVGAGSNWARNYPLMKYFGVGLNIEF